MLRNQWFCTGFMACSPALEASAVIALRSAKIAAGGAAARTEADRTVAEKIEAGLALQALAFTGGLGLTPLSAATKTVAHYRRTVRANRRRLTEE